MSNFKNKHYLSGYDEAVEAGLGGGRSRSLRERLTGLINLPGRREQSPRLEPVQKTVESRELATNPRQSSVVQDSVQQTAAPTSPDQPEETVQAEEPPGGAVHVEVHNPAEQVHNPVMETGRFSSLSYDNPPSTSPQQTTNVQ